MFATPALAQTAGATAPSGAAAFFSSGLVPMALILLIFWFFMLRPEQKRAKAHRAKIAAVKKGDSVVTGGGLMGKATKVDDETVDVEISKGVTVKAVKSMLVDVNPLVPAKAAND
jgi:preprotein translocase subunit YajC